MNALIENVGVNRAPAWIRQPGQVRDSGRDIFENENLIKEAKCFKRASQIMKCNFKRELINGFGCDNDKSLICIGISMI